MGAWEAEIAQTEKSWEEENKGRVQIWLERGQDQPGFTILKSSAFISRATGNRDGGNAQRAAQTGSGLEQDMRF